MQQKELLLVMGEKDKVHAQVVTMQSIAVGPLVPANA